MQASMIMMLKIYLQFLVQTSDPVERNELCIRRKRKARCYFFFFLFPFFSFLFFLDGSDPP